MRWWMYFFIRSLVAGHQSSQTNMSSLLLQPLHPLLARSFSTRTRRSSQVSSIFNFRLRSRGSEGEMADDEYSVPGDVVEGVGGRTYSGGTFSGVLPHPWPKRRPSTYSTASRSSQVLQDIPHGNFHCDVKQRHRV